MTTEKSESIGQDQPDISRRELSRQVCEMLGWHRPTGQPKDGSCRRALVKLQRKGLLDLPPAEGQWAFQNPLPPAQSLPEGCARAECSLADLGTVELQKVESNGGKAYRQWRAILEVCHRHGAGPLGGGRIRYLIRSRRGLLGALAFSSPAYQLRCREEHIGWSEAAREANREQVVQNSRFLILPQVQVPNLASHVLGKALRRLPEDWQRKYGYRAALAETYVDPTRHEGTCYRAAGWVEVGMTAGRGRGRSEGPKVPKRVFLRPLRPDWQRQLCREPGGTVRVLRPPAREPSDWAEAELQGVDLGDKRLDRRAALLLRQFWGKPLAPIPLACAGEANTRGAYRFFANPRTDMDKVLEPHIESALERAAEHEEVLVPQDSTSLNYTGLNATEGLGTINNDLNEAVGLVVHDAMFFTPEGLPLGLAHVECWSRDEQRRDKARIKEVPIEQKESYKWIRSYRALSEMQRQLGEKTRLISVCDREGDIYELLALARDTEQGAGLLVRAEKSRRRRTERGPLWEVMQGRPVEAELEGRVPARPGQAGRTARVEARRAEVTLQPPRTKKDLGTVRMWAVYARESGREEGEGLEWMLLTTEPTEGGAQAAERVEQYGCRWGVEVFHRTLKSGCRMEDRQLQTADRLTTCMALDMIVAWRVFHLTMLGRELPDVPCTVFFTEDEWRALVTFINEDPEAPQDPPRLQEAVEMVGMLGGYRRRKTPPGTETMWRGLQRLDDIARTWRIMHGAKNRDSPPGA